MAGEAGRHIGGSAALLELIEEHHSTLTFDFRRYFGVPLSEVGQSITHGEAWILILELRRETGSHTHMVRYGFTETSSLAEFAAIRHAEWYMNVHRTPKSSLIELPIPWEKPNPNADVTPERRAELEAQLQRRSAFA